MKKIKNQTYSTIFLKKKIKVSPHFLAIQTLAPYTDLQG